MKKSVFGWGEWEKASGEGLTAKEAQRSWARPESRRVRRIAVGGTIVITEGTQSFGSGGYGGYAVWQSPDGECPVEAVFSTDASNGFIGGDKTTYRAVRPGVVYHYEADCIRNDPFADDLFVIGQAATATVDRAASCSLWTGCPSVPPEQRRCSDCTGAGTSSSSPRCDHAGEKEEE